MQNELPKTYDPSEFEDRLYKKWEDSGYFRPSGDKNAPSFSMVIPPPNVTGQLHMGHALDDTLQDIIIRAKRMEGYNTLWVPGTDHAGIATQIKVEEVLRREKGLSRHDIGREEFLKLVWDWKAKYGNRIISQLKKLGASCDWEHEAFTMDENLSAAVRKTFVSLYEKGLIYRGLRITNWCPHCNTALSDAEVEYKELDGGFWYVKYPVVGSDEYVIIATTRPETMLGDTAVAVNPEDERYTRLIGKQLVLPLVGRTIPVIADEYVERDFGTGCVKITPCHDPNDFEVGLRHDLEQIIILDGDGKINENGGKYQGLDRFEARKQIVADLEAAGLLLKVEKLKHNVAHCYRCGSVIEPLASKQWFVKMKPLAGPAIKVVKEGKIRFIPERFSKIYLNWMENIHDWCVSRQLWWGHRIPAFYCGDCGKVTVSETDVTTCPDCGSPNITQESDVLDTWFSSALWPFSTLGWPNDTEDLKTFYPTNVLVTGYDIITFWVSKMIFMGIENTGSIPFPDVFIHGLVRDAQGRKMSKSLGNGIDPLEIIGKYGADALRFALATGNSPGNDMRFSDEKIGAARNFANKIWNASRFVRMNLDIEEIALPSADRLRTEDKWILSLFNRLAGEVRENIDSYELGIALSKLYDFIWDIFCDWYIELLKPRLSAKGTEDNHVAQNVIAWVLSNTMKLLHPFLPFITEEIWLALPHTGDSIMISSYPQTDPALDFPEDEASMDRIIELIKAVRNRRAEMNVPPSKKTTLYIVSAYGDTFNSGVSHFFTRLASASEVIYTGEFTGDNAVSIVTGSATAYIPLAEMIDTEKELARLTKELENTEKEIDRLTKKLSNEGFTSKAPAAVVEGEKAKLEKYRETLDGIKTAIANLPK
ncbi:valine--tRNA ligase [Candidatus Colimorpha enterica]|uniref:Valine--tRNA ligase n=1 Tax=Candidatus Colimorpha enterica TaxID=3083063 RepID=R6TYV7_9BACT|nr:valine--tRNA ligase [Candidatus Colimorpha enterica]